MLSVALACIYPIKQIDKFVSEKKCIVIIYLILQKLHLPNSLIMQRYKELINGNYQSTKTHYRMGYIDRPYYVGTQYTIILVGN